MHMLGCANLWLQQTEKQQERRGRLKDQRAGL